MTPTAFLGTRSAVSPTVGGGSVRREYSAFGRQSELAEKARLSKRGPALRSSGSGPLLTLISPVLISRGNTRPVLDRDRCRHDRPAGPTSSSLSGTDARAGSAPAADRRSPPPMGGGRHDRAARSAKRDHRDSPGYSREDRPLPRNGARMNNVHCSMINSVMYAMEGWAGIHLASLSTDRKSPIL
jgi:hypothetical protein